MAKIDGAWYLRIVSLLFLFLFAINVRVTAAAALNEADSEANTSKPMTVAKLHIEEAQVQYAEGNFTRSAAATLAAGRLLYSLELTPGMDLKTYADLTSKLSLLTLRLNRLVHDVSPELEPERFTMPIPYNPRIEREIDNYMTVSREEFARWLRRSGRYLPSLIRYFREENLPEDLVYVALVESGFNPRNRSSKEAVGLFQFMMSTGEKVGLKNNNWIDERRDPNKAAGAAVRHLKDLYREFGDWDLALASYNAGSGRVWKAIRNQGTRDYWQMVLPPETEAYVPKFYAALVISREPELYGFNPILQSRDEYEEIEVPGGVDLKVVAECIGVSLSVVADMNTELTKGCTPPGDDPYVLRLPIGTAEQFAAAFAELSAPRKFLSNEEISRRKFKGVYMVYKVKHGDDLYTIARKNHTTINKLREWNPSTRGKKYIHPGMKLRIYRVQ